MCFVNEILWKKGLTDHLLCVLCPFSPPLPIPPRLMQSPAPANPPIWVLKTVLLCGEKCKFQGWGVGVWRSSLHLKKDLKNAGIWQIPLGGPFSPKIPKNKILSCLNTKALQPPWPITHPFCPCQLALLSRWFMEATLILLSCWPGLLCPQHNTNENTPQRARLGSRRVSGPGKMRVRHRFPNRPKHSNFQGFRRRGARPDGARRRGAQTGRADGARRRDAHTFQNKQIEQ